MGIRFHFLKNLPFKELTDIQKAPQLFSVFTLSFSSSPFQMDTHCINHKFYNSDFKNLLYVYECI